MALPATDVFTAANGTALQTYSASWTINNGAFDIQSNQAHPNHAVNNSLAHWNADTFSDNQYAQITVTGAGLTVGVGVRMAASAATGYVFLIEDSSRMSINRWLAGTSVRIGTQINTPIPAVGQVLRLEVTGHTLIGKVNGVTRVTASDSQIGSGWAGIIGVLNGATVLLDDWEGGDLPTITTTHQALRSAKHQRRER